MLAETSLVSAFDVRNHNEFFDFEEHSVEEVRHGNTPESG